MSEVRSLALAGALCASLLAACGGGGSGGAADAAVTEFPLRAGYAARIGSGYSINFTVTEITGQCSGTATQTSSVPVAAAFEGVAGVAVTSTQSLTLPNCGGSGPLTSSASATDYYDGTFGALGSITGGQYGVFQPLPMTLPAAVKAGESGSLGVQTLYTDSSKSTVASRVRYSYVAAADTPTSAAVVLTTQGYDAADNPVFAESDHYRIAADGSLTLVFADIQYAGTNGLHLVLTPQ